LTASDYLKDVQIRHVAHLECQRPASQSQGAQLWPTDHATLRVFEGSLQ